MKKGINRGPKRFTVFGLQCTTTYSQSVCAPAASIRSGLSSYPQLKRFVEVHSYSNVILNVYGWLTIL